MGVEQRKETPKQNSKVERMKVKHDESVDTSKLEKGAKIGCEAELPFLEKFAYFLVYSYFLAIAVYKVYQFPLENPEELFEEDFQDGWKFLGRKKDTSDVEWQFWSAQILNLVLALLLHSLGSRLVSVVFPQHRRLFFAIFPLLLFSVFLGWKPALVFVAHNVVYYVAARSKSILFSWFVGLALLVSFVSVDSLVKWQFYKFAANTTEGDFVLFTSVMCQLRGLSFCFDSCSASKREKAQDSKDEVSYGFIDLLGYNLYLPLLCNGPVVLYDDFYKQINKPPKPLSQEVLKSFIWDAIRTFFWFIVMELGFHFLYVTSIARDPYLVKNVPVLTSTGLMYMLILLFSIKYVVLYRLGGMFSRLDGVNPPDIPKCVLNIYTFTVMWKTFDKGLHSWLMKYIYIPLGGSKHGIFRQIISSIATFAYVYYWHGAYDYLLYWSIIQWNGVFIEAMAAKLLKTKTLHHLERNVISPAATRRIHAIFGVTTILAAILSNCVFLVNHEPVVAYLKAVFINGGMWTSLRLAAVTYCLVQVIMEVELRTKENKMSKKNL